MNTKLVRFSVQGYRNFGKKITIDFQDVRDYKFSNECIDDGVITKMGIYGPNGCGKSNLGFALFNIVSYLTDKESGPLKNNPGIFLYVDEKTGSHYNIKNLRYNSVPGPGKRDKADYQSKQRMCRAGNDRQDQIEENLIPIRAGFQICEKWNPLIR